MSCLLATSMFFVAGCEDKNDPDKPSNSVPDPEGTIQVTVRSTYPGYMGNSVCPNDCYGCFFITSSNNFSCALYGNWKFASVGKVNGLGNVTKIPASGWANQVAIVPGHGYVGASSYEGRTDYVRIYVIDWIISTSGGIIGAEIKYQSPFIP